VKQQCTILLTADLPYVRETGKLILWPGSGGWSYPRNNEISEDMPGFQLYNLKNDPSEENNLSMTNPAKANELKELLAKYIEQGRSTPGEKQENEGMDKWPQIDWIKN
jgi:arylsulfatase A